MKKCESKCSSILIMDFKEDSWRKCIDEQMTKSNMYKECDSGFVSLKEKINCKTDLCNLCCIKGKNVYHEKNSEKCRAACALKFPGS